MLLLLTCKTIITASKHSFSYNYQNFFFSKKYRYESTALVLRDQIDIWQWQLHTSRFIMYLRYNQSTLFVQQRTIMIINVL